MLFKDHSGLYSLGIWVFRVQEQVAKTFQREFTGEVERRGLRVKFVFPQVSSRSDTQR
jgi:hypothetical protein